MDEILKKFENFGYVVQKPMRDKTYFFSKQTEKGTRQIWIKVVAVPEVECVFKYKPATLSTKEAKLVGELLGSLGYTTYEVK